MSKVAVVPKRAAPAPRRSEAPRPNLLQPEFEAGFLRSGVSPEAAKELARRLVLEYSAKDLENRDFAHRAACKQLAASLRTLSPSVFSSRQSWAAIGRPGSGKTSFLVKLAMFLKGQNRSVRLVSRDHRKLIGQAELATYSKLIGVPFVQEGSKRDPLGVELVDTPSICWDVEDEAKELEEICRNRSSVLILDPLCRLSELLRTVESARRFQPAALAFTKLDLVTEAGVIYEVLKATHLPLMALSVAASFRVELKFFESMDLASYLLVGRESRSRNRRPREMEMRGNA